MSDSSPSQSRLLTMTRAPGPGEKSRNRSSCAAERGHVRLERVAVEQVAFRRPAGRVADHPGPAADDRDRAAAEALESEQPEDRDEVPDVERVGRRIEPDVPAIGRPVARRPAKPGVAACRMPRHSSSSRGPSAAAGRAAVTGRGPRRLDREAADDVRSRPLCYRAALDADHSNTHVSVAPTRPVSARRRRVSPRRRFQLNSSSTSPTHVWPATSVSNDVLYSSTVF